MILYLLIFVYCIAAGLTQNAEAAPDSLNILAGLIMGHSESQGLQGADSTNEADKQYSNTQLDLLFADLQIQLISSLAARRFFARATRFGLPGTEGLRFFENYILSYDSRLKNPNWVLQYFDAKDFKKKKIMRRRLRVLFPDLTVHELFRGTDEDYKGTRYERGHMMAVSRNMGCLRHFRQTYYVTNIVPQFHDVNVGLFFRLENYVEYLAERSKNMYIVTGILYLPPGGINDLAEAGNNNELIDLSYSVIGKNRIGVPSHFYKVFVREHIDGQLSMEAFMVPNCQGKTRHLTMELFRVDIDKDLPELEKAAGLTLFGIIDRTKVAKPHTLHGFMENLHTEASRR